MKIVLGNLKDEGTELLAFLEPRVGTKPTLSGGALEIDDASVRAGVKPRHVKTYVKRFLNSKGLRKKFRVLVNAKELTVQELEVKEEEKEEKAKEAKEEKAPTPKEAPEEPAKEEKKEAKEAKKAEARPPEEKKEKPKAKKAVKPRKKKEKSK